MRKRDAGKANSRNGYAPKRSNKNLLHSPRAPHQLPWRLLCRASVQPGIFLECRGPAFRRAPLRAPQPRHTIQSHRLTTPGAHLRPTPPSRSSTRGLRSRRAGATSPATMRKLPDTLRRNQLRQEMSRSAQSEAAPCRLMLRGHRQCGSNARWRSRPRRQGRQRPRCLSERTCRTVARQSMRRPP